MCCPFSCLTSKVAVICQGIFCSMREKSVNNDTPNISTNSVLILLWWFCLNTNIGWTCSIDVLVFRVSVSPCSLHRSMSEIYFGFSLPGKRKQNFQLPCICNLAHVLGCIISFIYVRSSSDPLCINSDLRFPSKSFCLRRRKQNK